MNNSENVYSIPVRFRKMENLHIVFWLLKDISWCMVWRPLGVAMVFPTLIISIMIAWRTRQMVSELTHNLAITFWISANSLWMFSEYFHFDDKVIFFGLTGKHSAMIPFCLGAIMLLYYYAWWKPRHKHELETM